MRHRTLLLVVAPLAAVGTLMLALRVGANDAVRAARLFGAPPAVGAHDPSDGLAWQLVTFLDDRGVKETVSIDGLDVVARWNGKEAHWSGRSNVDGIAEVFLALPGIQAGDPVAITIRAAGDPEPLAAGNATWGKGAWGRGDDEPSAARPSKKGGAIDVELYVEGERLVPGFPTPLWIHAVLPGRAPAAGLTVELTPEAGLRADATQAVTCDDGWAELPVVAEGHVVGANVKVAAPGGGPSGEWYGALPVAPGAFFVGMPRAIAAGAADKAVLVAPNPRKVVYAEVADRSGRARAVALDVAVEKGDPTPRATFVLPPLAPGLHWLVVSGEPLGAEHLTGATIARPFLVGEAPGVDARTACSVGPWLARRPATGFSRWLALDGLPARSSRNRGRHVLGLALGVASLLVAGILETLLLISAAREAKAKLAAAEGSGLVGTKPPGGGLTVAILLALLGFALLAVLVLAKG